MGRGRVTFVSVPTDSSACSTDRVTVLVAEADIIIWAAGDAGKYLLRHAAHHADVVHHEDSTITSLLPFYDLASRDGLLVAHVNRFLGPDDLYEHIDRCKELGLHTNVVLCW